MVKQGYGRKEGAGEGEVGGGGGGGHIVEVGTLRLRYNYKYIQTLYHCIQTFTSRYTNTIVSMVIHYEGSVILVPPPPLVTPCKWVHIVYDIEYSSNWKWNLKHSVIHRILFHYHWLTNDHSPIAVSRLSSTSSSCSLIGWSLRRPTNPDTYKQDNIIILQCYGN